MTQNDSQRSRRRVAPKSYVDDFPDDYLFGDDYEAGVEEDYGNGRERTSKRMKVKQENLNDNGNMSGMRSGRYSTRTRPSENQNYQEMESVSDDHYEGSRNRRQTRNSARTTRSSATYDKCTDGSKEALTVRIPRQRYTEESEQEEIVDEILQDFHEDEGGNSPTVKRTTRSTRHNTQKIEFGEDVDRNDDSQGEDEIIRNRDQDSQEGESDWCPETTVRGDTQSDDEEDVESPNHDVDVDTPSDDFLLDDEMNSRPYNTRPSRRPIQHQMAESDHQETGRYGLRPRKSSRIGFSSISNDARSFTSPTRRTNTRYNLRGSARTEEGAFEVPKPPADHRRRDNDRYHSSKRSGGTHAGGRRTGGGNDRERDIMSELMKAIKKSRGGDNDDEPNLKRFNPVAFGGNDTAADMLPLNYLEVLEHRKKHGLLHPDAMGMVGTDNVDPLNDTSKIGFDMVGGLDHHIHTLKEMVFLPLLYPELYANFGINPPRGVLFHGPPGTGKTLVARALANSCSTNTTKISFFMRKGADILSKWVGEAERNLRCLFEEARKWQPSIIFFDEIDGLAPCRSGDRGDQVYASIVSSMLALMDGIDSRGQIVVIGSTNRIDSIDPALRRPGRFDRELYFGYPNKGARKTILDIATKKWKHQPSEEFKMYLAEMTKGYCGADIKDLCTRASLKAIQRVYPQIYQSQQKLLVEGENIRVEKRDFLVCFKEMTPASARSTHSTPQPIPKLIEPLLSTQLAKVTSTIHSIAPYLSSSHFITGSQSIDGDDEEDEFDDEDETSFESILAIKSARVFRPRLLVSGIEGMGQEYISGAVLYGLEKCHTVVIGLDTVVGELNPHQKMKSLFTQLLRQKPSIAYIPHIDKWWNLATEEAKMVLETCLKDLSPRDQVMLFATSHSPLDMLPLELVDWFTTRNGIIQIEKPTRSQRELFFSILFNEITKPFPSSYVAEIDPVSNEVKIKKSKPKTDSAIQALPVAPQQTTSMVRTEAQESALREYEQTWLFALRKELSYFMNQVWDDRSLEFFRWNVDQYTPQGPTYYDVVKQPICFQIILERLGKWEYLRPQEFLEDFDLIFENAMEWSEVYAELSAEVKATFDDKFRKSMDNLFVRAMNLVNDAHDFVNRKIEKEIVDRCKQIYDRRVRDGLIKPRKTKMKPRKVQFRVMGATKPDDPIVAPVIIESEMPSVDSNVTDGEILDTEVDSIEQNQQSDVTHVDEIIMEPVPGSSTMVENGEMEVSAIDNATVSSETESPVINGNVAMDVETVIEISEGAKEVQDAADSILNDEIDEPCPSVEVSTNSQHEDKNAAKGREAAAEISETSNSIREPFIEPEIQPQTVPLPEVVYSQTKLEEFRNVLLDSTEGNHFTIEALEQLMSELMSEVDRWKLKIERDGVWKNLFGILQTFQTSLIERSSRTKLQRFTQLDDNDEDM